MIHGRLHRGFCRPRTGGLLLAVLLLLPGLLWAEDFQITQAEIRLEEGVYLLDATIDYRFSDTVLEALEHGIPLTLKVHLQVRRQGAWIWEKDVVDRRLHYMIRYHALTALYEVSDLDQGVSQNFVTRDAAFSFLGEILALPVVKRERLKEGVAYILKLRTQLDIESLPLPLRPTAYISPSWNLSSEWHSWPLQP